MTTRIYKWRMFGKTQHLVQGSAGIVKHKAQALADRDGVSVLYYRENEKTGRSVKGSQHTVHPRVGNPKAGAIPCKVVPNGKGGYRVFVSDKVAAKLRVGNPGGQYFVEKSGPRDYIVYVTKHGANKQYVSSHTTKAAATAAIKRLYRRVA